MTRTIRWVVAALIDWGIIVAAIIMAAHSWWAIPIAILVVGNRQHALGILGHDGAHKLISRNSTINDDLTNWLAFYPMGLSLKQYREFHWEHHRNTNTDRDPEVMLKATKPNAMEMPYTKSKMLGQIIGDLFGLGIPHIVTFLMHVRPRRLADTGALAFVLVAFIALTAAGLLIVPIIWFAALYTTFWAFFRYRVWAEHVGGGPHQTLVFDVGTIHRWIFFPHNSNLHHVHHQSPGLAFHELHQDRIGKTFTEARAEGNFRTSKE